MIAHYHSLKSIVILLFFYLSFFRTSLLYSLRGLNSIVLIQNLLKSISSKDLNFSMSPSFITLILFQSKKMSNIFTKPQRFQITEIPRIFDQCSPVIIIEPANIRKCNYTKMVPVAEAAELFHIDFSCLPAKT
jgi:hypothetical protein